MKFAKLSVLALSLGFFLASCGGGDSTKSTSDSTSMSATTTQMAAPAAPTTAAPADTTTAPPAKPDSTKK